MKGHYVVLVSVALALVSQTAKADLFPQTEADFARLPPYCKVRLQEHEVGAAQVNYWKSILGPNNYIHIHHYCSGLHETNIAILLPLSSPERRPHFDQVIKSYQYIINHCEPTFVLLPEVFKNMGEAYIEYGNPAKAMEAFQKAIELKPDYTPAYASMAQFYMDQSQNDQAENILRKGLEVVPGSKLLKRRLESALSKSASRASEIVDGKSSE